MSDIKSIAKKVGEAEALVITAGAGIGVDSGLPDFRGNEGFWKAYPPIKKMGYSFAEMANPQWFKKSPQIAWAFYGHRLNLYRETVPHKGFSQLLEFGNSLPNKYFVFTSNVDGQFQKAGFDPNRIEECHGTIHHFQCAKACGNAIWDAKHEHIEVDMEAFEAQGQLPQCPNCGGLARPNILMFGDWRWVSARSESQRNRFADWLQKTSENTNKIVVVELGAGKHVPTVRRQSEWLADNYDATLIRINPRDYDVPNGHFGISLGAAEGIQAILDNI